MGTPSVTSYFTTDQFKCGHFPIISCCNLNRLLFALVLSHMEVRGAQAKSIHIPHVGKTKMT